MNQNIKIIIYSNFILFSVFRCKKNKDTIHIRGSVYDPNLKVNVSGARVILQSSAVQAGIYNSSYQDIGTANSDASGRFSFDIAVVRVLGYKIIINKNNYFYSETDINATAWSGGNTYYPVYDIYPQAYVKMHIQNVKPYDTQDIIYYSVTSINNQQVSNNCSGCCSDFGAYRVRNELQCNI